MSLVIKLIPRSHPPAGSLFFMKKRLDSRKMPIIKMDLEQGNGNESLIMGALMDAAILRKVRIKKENETFPLITYIRRVLYGSEKIDN